MFTAVTDPLAAQIVPSLKKPGGNVTGISDMSPMAEHVALIKEITPNVKKLGVIYNPGETNSVVLVARLKEVAGPAGIAAGAVVGGVVGGFVARVSDEEAERASFHDGELDKAIGVNGGDVGAPNLKHPPAVRGTYSAASSGGGSSGGGSSADGPMQTPED